MSKYSVSVDSGHWGGGSDITPLSISEAVEWLEDNYGTEAIEKFFPDYVQEA